MTKSKVEIERMQRLGRESTSMPTHLEQSNAGVEYCQHLTVEKLMEHGKTKQEAEYILEKLKKLDKGIKASDTEEVLNTICDSDTVFVDEDGNPRTAIDVATTDVFGDPGGEWVKRGGEPVFIPNVDFEPDAGDWIDAQRDLRMFFRITGYSVQQMAGLLGVSKRMIYMVLWEEKPTPKTWGPVLEAEIIRLRGY